MKRTRLILDSTQYFITCTTHQRKKFFSNPRFAQIVVDQWKHYDKLFGFNLHAYCVMHDHYHVLLDAGMVKPISEIMHAVNSYTAMLINRDMDKRVKMKIFQRRFWDEVIRNVDMYWQKVSYILFNPYREGLVRNPMDDYKYSNVHEWIAREGEQFVMDLFSRHRRWDE